MKSPLIPLAALLCFTAAAQAAQPLANGASPIGAWYHDAGFASQPSLAGSLTRAEVRAQAVGAPARSAYALDNGLAQLMRQPTAAARSRADVHAEAVQSVRAALVDGGERGDH